MRLVERCSAASFTCARVSLFCDMANCPHSETSHLYNYYYGSYYSEASQLVPPRRCAHTDVRWTHCSHAQYYADVFAEDGSKSAEWKRPAVEENAIDWS